MNINDLPFEHKGSEEVTSRAVEWFEKNRDSFRSTANYAIFFDTGKGSSKIGHACHYDIGQAYGKNKAVVATEIGISRSRYSGKAEAYIPFLKWFVQDSFFARFILNGSDLDFCRDYGILISADIPAPLLQNICIISRHFYEVPSASFKLWNELAKEFSPEVAYAVVMTSNLSTGPAKDGTVITSKPGHRAWGMFQTVKTLRNFLTGEFGDTLTSNEDMHYRTYATIYGGSKYCYTKAVELGFHYFTKDLMENDENFRKALGSFRGKDYTKEEVPNPFQRQTLFGATASPHIITYGELKKLVLPYLQEKGYFNAN